MHFRLILNGDFEAIVPQEGRIVQFVEFSRNSLHILAIKRKLACQPAHKLKEW